ncbi:BREX-1 system adenine-specific DNA-methyltransferase PglX [Alkaliphilus sp. B6464]|uniref:BREX-1 system adenine-specific DNA-methyltransferase PglX n=1 Tax=Alkaliphilus sp. B6464 TaxID=2731219 RepID=UPI001BAC51EA|nr:BREX-1 system adenine-specific DNA-methyltransferase PglX [Alkaliphilus sp. B6464]QUH20994.1 BREX-1 system adenine-specific DNA-methyltransferase PglX [Alkaliphilus sp. B6464]
MDKTAIKNFAIKARHKLTEGIIARIYDLGITKNCILDIEYLEDGFKVKGGKDSKTFKKYEIKQRSNLINKIKENGFEQLIEDVAYIWFIRLVAIRFMEVNDYISFNFKKDEFDKYAFINICNELAEQMPTIFEKIEDYIELLFPDNIFYKSTIIIDVLQDIEEFYWSIGSGCGGQKLEVEKGDCGIEIIGWLHQYYFSISKEEVFSDLKKKKLTKQNIPVATQIFTPKWIVKYMVENSLGKLWLESYPNEVLRKKWEYFIEDVDVNLRNDEFLKKCISSDLDPEKIMVLDPAMGSGHILVHAFDVFYDIYSSLGYSKEEIPILILEKNLYGLDIDDRVGKLAAFALLMKARSKNENIFKYQPRLNLATIQESNEISKETIDFFINAEVSNLESQVSREAVEYLVNTFQDAKEYGALLNIKPIDFGSLEMKIEKIRRLPASDLFQFQHRQIILEKLPLLIKQGKIMSQKYDVVVANPPYSGLRKFNNILKRFVEEHYWDYKYDLFSVFMMRNMNFTKDNGLAGFMTPNVWQFISSYENLRKDIINNYQLLSLIQLEDDGFKDASVSISTFVIRKCNVGTESTFIKLVDREGERDRKVEGKVLKNSENKFIIDQNIFKRIPGCKIAFWIGENTIKTLENGKKLNEIGKPRQGMATSDNNRFLRYWYEVNMEKIWFSNTSSNILNYKWVPYNKGGGYRKWYGNNCFVINWENNGYEIKEYAENLYGNYTRTIKNEEFYFKEGITYTFIGKDIGPRLSPKGFIFDVAGSMIFVEKSKLYYILGLVASKLSNHYMKFLNPSLNIQVGDIKNIPIIEPVDNNIYGDIDNLVIENINISKNDWDSFEISWDFKKHPILHYKLKAKTIKEAYKNWADFTEYQFNRLKQNEEKLNSIFINIYGIQEELTPEVEYENITIKRAKEERDIKSFISYGVGCMFGRYSLDEEGLIYAGGNFKYKFKFQDGAWRVNTKSGWKKSSINIVTDNMIPITENKSSKNDIVSRFIEFVKITFGEETLEENLNYVATVLYGETNETANEKLRRYFLKDFFLDHVKIYQKRPIYWMLDCKKEADSKFLIYMHRHKESIIDKIKNINLDDGVKVNYEKIISG